MNKKKKEEKERKKRRTGRQGGKKKNSMLSKIDIMQIGMLNECKIIYIYFHQLRFA